MRQFKIWLVTIVVTSMTITFPAAASAQTLNPYNPGIKSFLEGLGLDISPNESIWSDREFIQFIEKQQELQKRSDEFFNLLGELAFGSFDLIDLGNKIDDKRFEDLFGLDAEQLAELETIRAEMLQELEDIKKEAGQSVEQLFLGGFLQGLHGFDEFDFEDNYDDYEYDYEDEYNDNAPYIYDAYAEPWEPVAAGRIVRLYSDIENLDQNSEMTITWEQTFGPDVMWLNTENASEAAFIVPQYDPEEINYLEFMVTAENEYGSDEYYVFVDLEIPAVG